MSSWLGGSLSSLKGQLTHLINEGTEEVTDSENELLMTKGKIQELESKLQYSEKENLQLREEIKELNVKLESEMLIVENVANNYKKIVKEKEELIELLTNQLSNFREEPEGEVHMYEHNATLTHNYNDYMSYNQEKENNDQSEFDWWRRRVQELESQLNMLNNGEDVSVLLEQQKQAIEIEHNDYILQLQDEFNNQLSAVSKSNLPSRMRSEDNDGGNDYDEMRQAWTCYSSDWVQTDNTNTTEIINLDNYNDVLNHYQLRSIINAAADCIRDGMIDYDTLMVGLKSEPKMNASTSMDQVPQYYSPLSGHDESISSSTITPSIINNKRSDAMSQVSDVSEISMKSRQLDDSVRNLSYQLDKYEYHLNQLEMRKPHLITGVGEESGENDASTDLSTTLLNNRMNNLKIRLCEYKNTVLDHQNVVLEDEGDDGEIDDKVEEEKHADNDSDGIEQEQDDEIDCLVRQVYELVFQEQQQQENDDKEIDNNFSVNNDIDNNGENEDESEIDNDDNKDAVTMLKTVYRHLSYDYSNKDLLDQVDRFNESKEEQIQQLESELMHLRCVVEEKEDEVKELMEKLRMRKSNVIDEVNSEIVEHEEFVCQIDTEQSDADVKDDHDVGHDHSVHDEDNDDEIKYDKSSLLLEISNLKDDIRGMAMEIDDMRLIIVSKDEIIEKAKAKIMNRKDNDGFMNDEYDGDNEIERVGEQDKLMDKINKLKDKNCNLKDKNNHLKQLIDSKDEIIEDLKLKLLELTDKQLGRGDRDNNKLQRDLEEKSRLIDELQDRNNALNNRVFTNNQNMKDLENLRQILADKNEMIMDLESKIVEYASQIEELEMVKDVEANKLWDDNVDEKDVVDKEDEYDKIELIRVKSELINELECKLMAYSNHIDQLNGQVEEKNELIHDLECKMVRYTNRLEESKKMKENDNGCDNNEIIRLRRLVEEKDDLIEELNGKVIEISNRHQVRRSLDDRNDEDEENMLRETMRHLSQLVRDKEEELEKERNKPTEIAEGSSLEEIEQELVWYKENREELVVALRQKHEESLSYHTEMQKLAQQVTGLNQREQKLLREKQTLQEHLLRIEESYTQDAQAAEDREQILRDRVRELESNQENMTIKMGTMTEGETKACSERDVAMNKLAQTQLKLNEANNSLCNLQSALDAFQKDQSNEQEMERERCQDELRRAYQKINELSTKSEKLVSQLHEQSETVAAAQRITAQIERMEDELDAVKLELTHKEETIDSLRMEVRQLNSVTETKVDKLLMRNLMIGYFHTPTNKKQEALKIIGSLLNFSDDDYKQIGVDIANKSRWFSWLRNPLYSTISESGEVATTSNKSFSQLFVAFLERESAPLTNMRLPDSSYSHDLNTNGSRRQRISSEQLISTTNTINYDVPSTSAAFSSSSITNNTFNQSPLPSQQHRRTDSGKNALLSLLEDPKQNSNNSL